MTLDTNYTGRFDGLRKELKVSIDGVADFKNVYQYDSNLQATNIDQTGFGNSPLTDKNVQLSYDSTRRLSWIIRNGEGYAGRTDLTLR